MMEEKMRLVNLNNNKIKTESLDVQSQEYDFDVEQEKLNRKQKLISCYKKYANLKDDDEIDLDHLDDWALREACFQNNYRQDLLVKDLEQFKQREEDIVKR